MRRWLLMLTVCGMTTPGLAIAAQHALGYDLVVHVSDLKALPVPGQDGHVVGIAAFDGIAIFDDGRIANLAGTGSFEGATGDDTFTGARINHPRPAATPITAAR